MTPRFIARQLSHPKGFTGRIIGRMMNRRNARMNEFALEQLEVGSSDRVLEIGFGGGVNLATLIERARFVGGVDPSQLVIKRARAEFRERVDRGCAEFRAGSVEAIPFETAQFTKVCTVNTVYFWKSLDVGFTEIRRVIAPGGRVVVGFLPKEWMDRMGLPADIFTPRTSEEIVAALKDAGFIGVQLTRPRPSTAWNVMVARS